MDQESIAEINIRSSSIPKPVNNTVRDPSLCRPGTEEAVRVSNGSVICARTCFLVYAVRGSSKTALRRLDICCSADQDEKWIRFPSCANPLQGLRTARRRRCSEGTRRPIDRDNSRHNRAVSSFLKSERQPCRAAPTQPGEHKTVIPKSGICFIRRRPHEQTSLI